MVNIIIPIYIGAHWCNENVNLPSLYLSQWWSVDWDLVKSGSRVHTLNYFSVLLMRSALYLLSPTRVLRGRYINVLIFLMEKLRHRWPCNLPSILGSNPSHPISEAFSFLLSGLLKMAMLEIHSPLQTVFMKNLHVKGWGGNSYRRVGFVLERSGRGCSSF